MTHLKRKAFTLTELLVVVVIVGVLAAVVLPKFSKVMETRKTTEAEEMMAAVRTEQEARCSISKNYTANFDKLASLNKQSDTKNYKYEDLGGVGIQASAKGSYEYSLQMPSYVDGRICCEGEDCAKLNKNYPSCADLTDKDKTPDFIPGNAQCSVPPDENSELEPEPEDNTTYCEEGKPGWNEWQDVALRCEHGQDARGTWNTSTCKCDCPGGSTYDESSGECVNACAPGTAGWAHWSSTAQDCEQPQDPSAKPGTWNTSSCKCDCPDGSTYDESSGACVNACAPGTAGWAHWSSTAQTCEQPQDPSAKPGTWNTSSCECDCPDGTTLTMYGECIAKCDMNDQKILEKAQDCETGGQTRYILGYDGVGKAYFNVVPGQWNRDTCGCDCPSPGKHFYGPNGTPNEKYEFVSWNGLCYLHCLTYLPDKQEMETCLYGNSTDRAKGIAEPGFWNQWTCQCQCATRYGVKTRYHGGDGVSCYRDNCEAGVPGGFFSWQEVKNSCEKSGTETTATSSTTYVAGKWNAEKCQCNCPKGNVKYYLGSCVVTGPNVDTSVYYDDEGPDNGHDDYPDQDEGQEYDPDDYEDDEDGYIMGGGHFEYGGPTIIWGSDGGGEEVSTTDITVEMDFDNDSICYGADC